MFQRKEDFGRVYGLTAGQYHRLAPYIRIAPEFRPAAELEEVQRSIMPTVASTDAMPLKATLMDVLRAQVLHRMEEQVRLRLLHTMSRVTVIS